MDNSKAPDRYSGGPQKNGATVVKSNGSRQRLTPAQCMQRKRAKEQWFRWEPWGCMPCEELKEPGSCPFFENATLPGKEGCGYWRRYSKRKSGMWPVCPFDKNRLLELRDNLAATGIPPALAMVLASCLLRSSRGKDGNRLADSVASKLNQLEVCRLNKAPAGSGGRNGNGTAEVGGALSAYLLQDGCEPAADSSDTGPDPDQLGSSSDATAAVSGPYTQKEAQGE